MRERGFSLIEVLVSVALLTIAIAIGTLAISMQARQTVALMERARLRSTTQNVAVDLSAAGRYRTALNTAPQLDGRTVTVTQPEPGDSGAPVMCTLGSDSGARQITCIDQHANQSTATLDGMQAVPAPAALLTPPPETPAP